ncbi:hypothetical protein [Promicromonospora sukumoe]|uniref:hypothetical protein n=1 Tax=Promicromonospora sukumoe TaxID=88382 RepID=UPI000382E05D|nr:hypothetical protein [Promicromonospora sukumoe]
MLNTRSPGEPYLVERNPGYFEYQLPVSVKAVVGWRGRLPLLRNERDEWELPDGYRTAIRLAVERGLFR